MRAAEKSEGRSELERLLLLGRWLREDRKFPTRLASKVLKVRDRYGNLRHLVANEAQMAFEQRRSQQNIVLKARQMGMTTWIAGMFFLRTITARGVLTVQVAQSRDAVEGIFRIVQRMWENLPADLRNGPLRRSRANVGQMVFPVLDSEFRVWSAADQNACRGLSIQNLHCSEVSRWPGDAAGTLAGLRAALAPDGQLVMESTPNGAYGAFHDEWSRAVDADSAGADHGSGVVRHFLPWWMEPAYVSAAVANEAMTEEERRLVERHGLHAEQIGYRRDLARNFGMLRSQEFAEDAETCFRASGDCCFDTDAIEQQMAAAGEPMQQRRGGALLVWLPPLPGRTYVVAVDTAGGGEHGDFAAVQVIDLATGMQCAELQERLQPLELAATAAALARDYNDALLVVERNNHGGAVLAYLETVQRYSRIYMQRGMPGWLTTSASKPEMVARLGALLVEQPELMVSKRLLAECRTFVRGEQGRTGAANGAHDDLVMAMAIAQTVRAERCAGGQRTEERSGGAE